MFECAVCLCMCRYGLARTEYTVMCDPNLLFGQVLNYAAKELGLPAPTFEPVTKGVWHNCIFPISVVQEHAVDTYLGGGSRG